MRLGMCLLKRVRNLVDFYSQFTPSSLTIQQLVDFGSKNACEKTSFIFLRKEIPVRLANIMKEINLLPEQLLSMPSVQLVESWYEQSFEEILQYEKVDAENSKLRGEFTKILEQIRNRHSKVVETMAQGMIEMKETANEMSPQKSVLDSQIQYFLDRFYMSRVGIRMLINQHVLLFGPHPEFQPQHIGTIDITCDVMNVAQDAYDNARFLCDQYYLIAPECDFIMRNPFEEVERITMTYVPSHLYHMLFELYKNSMRAVVETHGEHAVLPKLRTIVCKGKDDLTIRISDEGGGIPMAQLETLFNYMYSTAPQPPSPQQATCTPLAGYGYGLPLSRLYARYFQGDLRLSSMEGFGTDAFIYLKVHPDASNELLPIYNRTSSNRYINTIRVADWSDPNYGRGTGWAYSGTHSNLDNNSSFSHRRDISTKS